MPPTPPQPRLTLQLYEEGQPLITREYTTAEEVHDALKHHGLMQDLWLSQSSHQKRALWVDLQDTPESELEGLGKIFGFHPLSMKSAFSGANQPPILQLFSNHAYLLLHRIFYRFEEESVEYRPVSAFFSSHVLITVHASHLSRLFQTNRTRAESAPQQYYRFGVGTVLLCIIEGLIADYGPILEQWQEDLDALEEEILNQRSTGEGPEPSADGPAAKTSTYISREQSGQVKPMMPQILKYKKLAGHLRKSLHPQRQVLAQLNDHARNPWMDEQERPWVKHVLEEWNTLLREIDHLRTHVAGVFEVYATALTLEMTHSSNQQNRVMQRLNVITAVFLPLTFIVGVYGMNIPDIPEIKVPGFYSLLWGVMIGLSFSLIAIFKWMRWF